MDQPKITETFADKAKRKPRLGNGIEAPHEPLAGQAFQLAPQAIQTLSGTPVPLSPPTAPAAQPAPLKVAIVGTAPSSRNLAPYNDPTWQIWVCSPGNMNSVPRVDAWFEIHSNLLWPENQHYGVPYIDWLKQQKFPVFMQDNLLVPNAIPLPKDQLVARWGKFFFTSSFSWMMAMAIEKGAQEIALFGVDMASKDEYIQQRSGGQYFLQEAAKLGIRVSIPHESDLAQPPGLYGYDSSTPFGRKVLARQKEVQDRINAMVAERDKLNHQITYLQGALEDVQYWNQVWSGVQT